MSLTGQTRPSHLAPVSTNARSAPKADSRSQSQCGRGAPCSGVSDNCGLERRQCGAGVCTFRGVAGGVTGGVAPSRRTRADRAHKTSMRRTTRHVRAPLECRALSTLQQSPVVTWRRPPVSLQWSGRCLLPATSCVPPYSFFCYRG
jgi:hypothetical protein